MERQRGITIPETLLRLFLLHVARGYSLRETAVRASESGLATISDVGLLKRLRRSEDWLHWLCAQMVFENGVRMPQHRGRGPVRIVDGTIIREPGKTGSQWRILYSMQLPDLRCDYFDLTATAGSGTGESFARLPVAKHDLILGDAGGLLHVGGGRMGSESGRRCIGPRQSSESASSEQEWRELRSALASADTKNSRCRRRMAGGVAGDRHRRKSLRPSQE